MARTLSQLLSELNTRVGDDPIDEDISTNWTNTAWQEALAYYPWPFLKASAAGTLASDTSNQDFSNVFSVSDFGRMVQLLVGDIEYTRVDWEDKDKSSHSQVYALLPDMTGIVIPGSDGGDAIMKYIKHLPDIDGGQTVNSPQTGTTGVPVHYTRQFEEAVVAGAATRYFQNALKPGVADYWQSQRDFYLDQILEDFQRGSTADEVKFFTQGFNGTGTEEF
jgi:hypothetical protein